MTHGPFRPPPTVSILPTLLALAAPPLVTFLGIWSWAAGQRDPTAGAEGGYLALLAAWVMACAAVLAPRVGSALLVLSASVVLTLTAVWVVPGPTRGAAVLVVLLTTVVVAVSWRLVRLRRPGSREKSEALPLPVALALALVAQAFCRGDRFLFSELDGSTVATLFGLPMVGGMAVWTLSRQRGWPVALMAAGVVLVATPGWTTLSALGLLGIAAGREWSDRRWAVPGVLVALALAAGIGGRAEALAAVVVLLLSFLLDQKAWGWAAAVGALGMSSLGLLAFGGAAPGGLETRDGLLWLLLAPGLFPLLWRGEGRRRVAVATLAAGLGLWFLPGSVGLGLAAALLCAGLPAVVGLRSTAPSMAAAVQGGWTLALVVATALLASYPWLRAEPLITLLDKGGAPYLWLVALGGLMTGTVVASRSPKTRPWRWFPLPYASTVLVLVLLPLSSSLLGPGGTSTVLLTGETVTLTTADPVWAAPCPQREARAIVVDSSVAHGAALPAGTPVAAVAVSPKEAPRSLRLGSTPGEWAARRPGVVAAAPEPWLSTVAPEGAFFAQRYRARLAVPLEGCRAVEIRRNPALPKAVTVTLFFVEARHGG